ncbi:type II secretion system protein GspM [Methylobacterium nigriterrae]|uniref:type II secretion system protein GspM n=1 Tax=Methylobacterium nigriterrae TaxID=3127512 RepID=UPI0030132E08
MTWLRSQRTRWVPVLAWGVFVGLPFLLVLLIVQNLLRWSDASTQATVGAQQIAQIEARLRSGEASAPAAQTDGESIYLAASHASLAAAELQRRLVNLVEQSGGHLLTVKADEAGTSLANSLVLQVTFESRQAALLDLLAAAEASIPFLAVETLSLQQSDRRKEEAGDVDPTLRVVMAVRAYQREPSP